jgi:hypothetical protein
MYFDNLTIVSLLVFAIAFGSFVYACVVRGCMAKSANSSNQHKATRASKTANQSGRGT